MDWSDFVLDFCFVVVYITYSAVASAFAIEHRYCEVVSTIILFLLYTEAWIRIKSEFLIESADIQ